MIIKNVSLDIVCGITSRLPETKRPEIAFAGKSNVGKSSLINALMNRKALARTSSQPGKTQKMIEKYLHTSKDLKAVFLLVDIRHEPSANDKQMYDWILHNGYEPIIIATKLDKLKRSQVQKSIKAIREGLKLPKEGILIPFSAETKQGREEIWNLMDELTGLGEETEKEQKA